MNLRLKTLISGGTPRHPACSIKMPDVSYNWYVAPLSINLLWTGILPVPPEHLSFVEQASCLLLTIVQEVSDNWSQALFSIRPNQPGNSDKKSRLWAWSSSNKPSGWRQDCQMSVITNTSCCRLPAVYPKVKILIANYCWFWWLHVIVVFQELNSVA